MERTFPLLPSIHELLPFVLPPTKESKREPYLKQNEGQPLPETNSDTESEASQFIDLIREATGEFRCLWGQCKENYSTRTGLATHCSVHLHEGRPGTTQGVACQWNQCCAILPSSRELAKHLSILSHIGQMPFIARHNPSNRPKKYVCSFEGCTKAFSDSSNRKKHELTHNTNRERFYCSHPGCEKSYSTRTDLRIHQNVHQEKYPHKCSHPRCDRAFVRVSELYAHERTHDQVMPYSCDICGKGFKDKTRCQQHQQAH